MMSRDDGPKCVPSQVYSVIVNFYSSPSLTGKEFIRISQKEVKTPLR